MKHDLKITLFLVLTFVFAQIIGLIITGQYIDYDATSSSGNATFKALPGGIERPEVEESSSFFWIMGAVLFGTVIVLVLIRLRRMNVWKTWFLLSVVFCLTVGIAAFLPPMVSFILAIILGVWKIYRPNIIIHNLTELFVYGGLAAIFVSMINLFSGFVLLFLISLYDMYAVWKSKHMITLAKEQGNHKLFAGLMLPYSQEGGKAKLKIKGEMHSVSRSAGKGKESKKSDLAVKRRSAILGGGDIGFPLIFSTVVYKSLIIGGISRIESFALVLIITLFTSISLLWLLMKGEKDKFYPAMPFLSLGCLMGFIVVAIIKPGLAATLIQQTKDALISFLAYIL